MTYAGQNQGFFKIKFMIETSNTEFVAPFSTVAYMLALKQSVSKLSKAEVFVKDRKQYEDVENSCSCGNL